MLTKNYIYICIVNIIFLCFAYNQSIKQSDEIDLLEIRHNELLNIFSSVNSNDFSKYLSILNDEKVENDFLNALDVYNLTLSLALSDPNFVLNTSTKIINTYKNDSKFFSELKSKLLNKNRTEIINISSYQEEEEQYNTIQDKFSADFKGNYVLSFKYSKVNNFVLTTNSDKYSYGNSIDLMFYSPKNIKLNDKDYFLAYNLNFSESPSKGNGIDLEMKKINLHLINYLDTFPFSLDYSFGISDNGNHGGYGFTLGFDFSYYIPIEIIDLSINVNYDKFINIDEDYNFDFDAQDLIGINLCFGKNIIFK